MEWPVLPPAPRPDLAASCIHGYGHGEDSAIPDTPLDQWAVLVEAVLVECAERSAPCPSS